MLKGIPSIISPDLMKVLMEMGHGDDLVLGDANFPAASCAQRLIGADGHTMPQLLQAILRFFPLDTYVSLPVALMALVGTDERPPIWNDFQRIFREIAGYEGDFEYVERFDFYRRAQSSYAIVSTGETALYGNVILKKGVVVQP